MKKDKLNITGQNLVAYEGVEDLKTFASKQAIEKYRQERKQFASAAVSFLGKKIKDKKPVSVLDIGSGSSCLLYALHDAGILSDGMGIEISKTRHDFAERWKKDEKYSSIENVNKDIRKVSFKNKKFDICTILDSTFTFFAPVDPKLPEQMIQLINKSLNKGGWLIIDMTNFFELKLLCNNTNIYYSWQELPDTNKFRYSLYKRDFSSKEDILCSESRYIYRNRLEETTKIEYSKMYTVNQLKRIVLKAGFKNPLFFGGYDESRYDPKKSKRILLTCRL